MAHIDGFTIRRATHTDIETLVQLMHDFYVESQYQFDTKWATESFSALLSKPALGCVWLVVESGRVIGHVVLTVRYTMEHGGLSAYIDDLYVKPEFRRRGAASAMLDSLLAECRTRECKSIHVEVGKSNIAAVSLYSKHGLQRVTDGRILLSATLPPQDT